MIKIDGSHGEGGGQILRTATALSVLTKKPIEISNIRANRPNPGIKPQHYIAIKSIKELCNADVEGLEIGSSKLRFFPDEVIGGKYKVDIGTAGSITLVFQALILAMLKTPNKIQIKVSGGTDVKWSPSWDYFEHVFIEIIRKMGVSVESKLLKRGYYPKGGGEALLSINPGNIVRPLRISDNLEYNNVNGVIHVANLPDHIATRMKHSVMKLLLKNKLQTSILIDKTTSLSAGTGISLWSQLEDTVIGSTMIGEKGIPSENIGRITAEKLIKDIDNNVTLDTFAADQIIPYMVLACDKGFSSFIIRKISNHMLTNMWLIKQFYNVDFESKQIDDTLLVKVK